MDTRQRRGEAVADMIDKVRAVERDRGVTPDALDAIKGLLVELAGRRELFPPGDFPVNAEDGTGVIYRLAEDPDHRFALYATAGAPGKSVPPHNHTTWAVIVGVHGDEHNVFYERVDDGSVPGRGEVRPSGEFTVTHGTGVTLMPDDIHSFHVTGDKPTVHLHMYGLALEQLHQRIMFDTAEGTYKVVPAPRNIRPA